MGEPAREPGASPCVRHCTLDETDTCVGCRRTIAEITAWSRLGIAEREAILAVLPGRRSGR